MSLPALSAALRRSALRRGNSFAPRALASTRAFASLGPLIPVDTEQHDHAVKEFEAGDLPSENDLLAMIRRLENPRPTLTLPLLVIESMLPGQRLILDSAFDSSLDGLADAGGEIGVFGMSSRPPASSGDRDAHCHLHSHGVSARLQRNATWQQWEIIAQHAIQHVGPAGSGPNGVDLVQAQLIVDDVSEADVEAAKALPPLVDEWCEQVLRMNVERFEGQLNGVVEDLGEMPSPESPGDLAFWVAALVNPLPALGVAFEIRPKVLAARSVSDRLKIARKGIEGSIEHITGRRLLF